MLTEADSHLGLTNRALVLAALAEVHFPTGTEDERYFQMGQAFIRGFANSGYQKVSW